MKSSKINQKFQKYIDNLADPTVFRKYPQDVAAIIGSDQFKIDNENNRVKLPEMGWVTLEVIPPANTVSWIALFKSDEGYEIAFGNRGISPFSDQAAEFLPVIDGVILAMPFIEGERLKDKMVAT
jgi:hypothetical protein